LQRKLKNYSSQGGWLVSRNLLQFEVIQKFSFVLKKEFIAVQKDGNELKERGPFFWKFSWFCWKMKKLNVWFYFFIPMVFGLIRPWFCYVTFLKIPYSLRKFLQFFMIFLGIFFGKKPSWCHGDLWFSFCCFMFVSNIDQ